MVAGTVVVGSDELGRGQRAWIHEELAGRRWRVSAPSFFQASPEGAEALVATVADHVDRHAVASDRPLVIGAQAATADKRGQ